MSSAFDSLSHDGDDDAAASGGRGATTRPFDDGYLGYNPRLPSQRFDSFSTFSPSEDADDPAPPSHAFPVDVASGGAGDGFVFHSDDASVHVQQLAISDDHGISVSDEGYGFSTAAASPFTMPQANGTAHGVEENGEIFRSDGPILPDLDQMQMEEGFLLREWRRQNAIQLEEKERKEKDSRNEIISEAEQYIQAFYEKRKINCETNSVQNTERRQLCLANQEKFHANADKQYWKAISEFIPHEIASIEKKRGKQEQEKKPSVVVIQGPKPGKPTDLSRMRHILVKLKHTPPHMKPPTAPPPPPPVAAPAKDAKDGAATPASDAQPNGAAAITKVEIPATERQGMKAPELVATA
ncbi:hypothetical protein ZIOFF_054118 [Zingiber officinale]|uniref:Clathrin light chain n=1 Tax=Zingiber officinale TaxID=94328 RepID=A0A8J5FH34_ZINOF|nr:hypothetical protein ZIOFF_054118 [Zingiber officinale]